MSSFEEELKKFDKITNIDIEINNPNYNPNDISSKGFDDPYLDTIWKQAKRSGADWVRFRMIRVGHAENWNTEVTMYSPERYTGIKRLTKRLGDWLISL